MNKMRWLRRLLKHKAPDCRKIKYASRNMRSRNLPVNNWKTDITGAPRRGLPATHMKQYLADEIKHDGRNDCSLLSTLVKRIISYISSVNMVGCEQRRI